MSEAKMSRRNISQRDLSISSSLKKFRTQKDAAEVFCVISLVETHQKVIEPEKKIPELKNKNCLEFKHFEVDFCRNLSLT